MHALAFKNFKLFEIILHIYKKYVCIRAKTL